MSGSGCPPTPAATIYGFAVALGLLNQKLKGQDHVEEDNERVQLLLPSIPLATRVMIEREARRQAGYYQGREISDRFLTLLENATPEQVKGTMQTGWMKSRIRVCAKL